jgi:aspartate-semialdehyde dehydrogenase
MRTAVLGATGLVGRTMLGLLETRDWVDEPPLLLTGTRSAGTTLTFRGRAVVCADAASASLAGVMMALFSAGGAASRTYAPRFAAAGSWVVDNSSAWRMDPEVPLVVPEINAAALPARPGIVANPNCSTIQVAAAVAPLQRAFGLKACHVTTLQAASGGGGRARQALAVELSACLPGLREGHASPAMTGTGAFPRRLALNALPEIGAALPDGSFEEEAKVGRELRKILGLPQLAVTCLATRVPVWNGHAAAVRCVCGRSAPRDEVIAALSAAPGLVVAESPHGYATQLEADGADPVFVGRVRGQEGRPEVVLMWVVADNVRKGAALNAVQIADLLAARTRGA